MDKTLRVIRANPWIPKVPSPKQLRFLSLGSREAFYGGAAGGGKSEALLMGAALGAEQPGYVAMLFRRTFADLALPSALMDRAQEWWGGTGARWVAGKARWEFPTSDPTNPAIIGFGYLDGPNDHLRYKSMEAQFIGVDEATDIREAQLKYMNTRLRRRVGMPFPPMIRYGGNPGGESHHYFGNRFVYPAKAFPVRPFVAATLEDNPHADREDYAQTLAAYDPEEVTYRQLRWGEWIADDKTTYFKPEWWKKPGNRFDTSDPTRSRLAIARFAALDTANKKEDGNAFTALVVGELTRQWRLETRYVTRDKLTFDELPDWVAEQLAPWAYDGKLMEVYVEDAASGTQLLQVTEASGPDWLRPIMVAVPPTSGQVEAGKKGDSGKEVRWRGASLWCRRDCVLLPYPDGSVPEQLDFEAELYNVPNTKFKDFADAFGILVNEVEAREEAPLSTGWRMREARRMQAEGLTEYGMMAAAAENGR